MYVNAAKHRHRGCAQGRGGVAGQAGGVAVAAAAIQTRINSF